MFKNGLVLTKEFPQKVIIDNKNSRRNKDLLKNKDFEFHWKILKREKALEFDGIFYSYFYPTDSISSELTNSFLLNKLKLKEIFDFDYEPEEFDNLQIFEKAPSAPYLSFVFVNGEWTNDFPYFNYENSLKCIGFVKPKNNLIDENK